MAQHRAASRNAACKAVSRTLRNRDLSLLVNRPIRAHGDCGANLGGCARCYGRGRERDIGDGAGLVHAELSADEAATQMAEWRLGDAVHAAVPDRDERTVQISRGGQLAGIRLKCDRSFPPTNNTVVASARRNTAPRCHHTGNGAYRAVIYVPAADAMSDLIAVYLGQFTAQWKAVHCWCNRNLCAPRCDDYSIERRVVRVNLRIVGPGIRMRKYCMNPVVTNAEGFGVDGIHISAKTEWRLRGEIRYFRIGINIAVWKGADVSGTSIRVDECAELARMIDRAAWILPTRSIHTVLGAVGIRVTRLAVKVRRRGAKRLPFIASGVGETASAQRFERELVLSTIREAGDGTVSSLRFAVVFFDDVTKNCTIHPGRRKLGTFEPERRGTAIVRAQVSGGPQTRDHRSAFIR